MENKRGSILVENIIFIILNLVFLGIIIVFILNQGSGITQMEESYAKQIALIFDSAKPGMSIFLNFGDGIAKVKTNFGENYLKGDLFKNQIVRLNGNTVTVRLKEGNRQGYSYSFFNDINLSKVGYYINGGGINFVFER